MKRSNINRLSPQLVKRRNEAKANWADSQWIYFSEIGLWLRGRCADWKQLGTVRQVDDVEVASFYHRIHDATCWMCGKKRRLEVHHLVPRSDEPTNLVMLCGHTYDDSCHRKVQDAPQWLPAVLRAKCTHDRMNLSWLRLTILRGKGWGFDSLDEENA